MKKVETLDTVAAFDIETTSFRTEDGSKAACMYVWQMQLNDNIIMGRTWEEFEDLCYQIHEELHLSRDRRLIIWVHNLAFEFQFLKDRFAWEEVFALEQRKPVRALSNLGIEFRCSLILSGFSLAKLGGQLVNHDVRKAVGDLDYSLPRHSGTPLTEEEIGYCVADVQVVCAYIEERLAEEGHIDQIPLTKTSYVRRYCRQATLGDRKTGQAYAAAIKKMQLTAPEYDELREAFQGGFTHANPWYVNKTLHNVGSYDFTSSYPTVMISEQFPMSSPTKVTINSREDMDYYLRNYCCMFDLRVANVKPSLVQDNPISSAKCKILTGATVSNGRVVSASELCITCTEVDYEIYKKFYTWDHEHVANFRIFERSYLPTTFVKSIIQLYKDKTQLKGVAGKESEYLVSKGMLNSCYGMAVTSIVRDTDTYTAGQWITDTADADDELNHYNKARNRFLYYPWGVWVTAYARRNLFTGIAAVGDDYVYSDTDSIKMLHPERHVAYIEAYNEWIVERLHRACIHHGIPLSDISPCSIDGKAHTIGVWDYEGTYDTFKTLGAKRYLTHDASGYHLTVAGLRKQTAITWMQQQGDPFEVFEDGMTVPEEYSGRITHTYLDSPIAGELTDYLGNKGVYHEYSAMHLEEAGYTMSQGADFIAFLSTLKER